MKEARPLRRRTGHSLRQLVKTHEVSRVDSAKSCLIRAAENYDFDVPDLLEHMFCIVTNMADLSPEEAEALRRSIAVLPPQAPSGLSRERAIAIVGQLVRVLRDYSGGKPCIPRGGVKRAPGNRCFNQYTSRNPPMKVIRLPSGSMTVQRRTPLFADWMSPSDKPRPVTSATCRSRSSTAKFKRADPARSGS